MHEELKRFEADRLAIRHVIPYRNAAFRDFAVCRGLMSYWLGSRGHAVRRSARDAKRTWLAQAIAQLDGQERDTLFKAGDIIKRLAEK